MPTVATAAAIVSAVTAVAGTAVSVHAAREQGKAQEKAAKFNEAVARNNAIAASQQAQFEADQVRRRNLMIFGKQRSAAAKSGVQISGSVADVIDDSAIQGELDRLATLYSGAVATGAHRSQAQLQRLAGQSARRSANLQAAGSLLSGLSGTSQKVADFPGFSRPKTTTTGSATTIS